MSDLTYLVGGVLVDGNGGSPVHNSVIALKDGRILSVGAFNAPIPEDCRQIQVTGKYIIPGLLDANVHLVYGFSTEYLLRFEERFTDIVREATQVALRSGVTTVFDTWGPLQHLKTVRDEINQGTFEGSRIFFAGNIIGLDGPFSPDFYASTESVSMNTVRRINAMYEQGMGRELTYMLPEKVRLALRAYLDNGIDFVKYAVSGHAKRDLGLLMFSPIVQQIIIEEARARYLPVETHTTSVESLRLAVEAGVDLLQHPNLTASELVPSDVIEKIAAKGIASALAIAPRRYLEHVLGEELETDPSFIADFERRLQRIGMQNARNFIDAGARIVMATDGGVPFLDCPLLHSVFLQRPYLEILDDISGFFGNGHVAWLRGATEAGLSPMNVLQAATKNVAMAYGKSQDLGTIEAGKVADIVILDADPLADPANYRAIHMIIKAGKVVRHKDLPTKRILTAYPGNDARAEDR